MTTSARTPTPAPLLSVCIFVFITLTFARVDHEVEEGEVPGVVVSRINLSPRFMRELIDAMEDNFSKWRTREGIRDLPELGEPD